MGDKKTLEEQAALRRSITVVYNPKGEKRTLEQLAIKLPQLIAAKQPELDEAKARFEKIKLTNRQRRQYTDGQSIPGARQGQITKNSLERAVKRILHEAALSVLSGPVVSLKLL